MPPGRAHASSECLVLHSSEEMRAAILTEKCNK